MKKAFVIIACMMLSVTLCYAQSSKDLIKERKELAKQSKAELNEKASKAARKKPRD